MSVPILSSTIESFFRVSCPAIAAEGCASSVYQNSSPPRNSDIRLNRFCEKVVTIGLGILNDVVGSTFFDKVFDGGGSALLFQIVDRPAWIDARPAARNIPHTDFSRRRVEG